MDETLMGREQPVDEQGTETLKSGIELRLAELGSLLGAEETVIYVESILRRMCEELEEG